MVRPWPCMMQRNAVSSDADILQHPNCGVRTAEATGGCPPRTRPPIRLSVRWDRRGIRKLDRASAARVTPTVRTAAKRRHDLGTDESRVTNSMPNRFGRVFGHRGLHLACSRITTGMRRSATVRWLSGAVPRDSRFLRSTRTGRCRMRTRDSVVYPSLRLQPELRELL